MGKKYARNHELFKNKMCLIEFAHPVHQIRIREVVMKSIDIIRIRDGDLFPVARLPHPTGRRFPCRYPRPATQPVQRVHRGGLK